MKQVYLLTGQPGTGKTSLIKEAVSQIKGRVGGFYTEEIRSRGVREGFRLVTLEGETAILAHINIKSPYRVSKYGVDVDGFDRVGVSALNRAAGDCDFIVIDEIGKMELFSASFRKAVLEIIDGGKRVLGTIMLAPHPWADVIKARPDVKVIEVTRNNHAEALKELSRWLKESES